MKNPFHMICRFLLFPVAKLIVPCKVMDKYKYKKYDHGQMIIGNHLSWMDVAYQIFWIPGYKRTLSKKENEGGKLRNWFMRKVGVLFINRDNPELSSMRECINALKNDETLCIFPEGTRNRVNREIQEMHSGAAMFAVKGEASVVPIAVHHKGKLFHRNYLGVGDRIDISSYFGKRLDNKTLLEITDIFRAELNRTLDKLDKWVENKGWKTERKKAKAEKRELKVMYKQAKKSAKLAKKSGKGDADEATEVNA